MPGEAEMEFRSQIKSPLKIWEFIPYTVESQLSIFSEDSNMIRISMVVWKIV